MPASIRRREPEWEPSVTLVLAMLSVVIRQGASIVTALDEVGQVLDGEFGEGLCHVAMALTQGVSWHEAWVMPCSSEGRFHTQYQVIRDALDDSWAQGSSPVDRLRIAIEQLDAQERASIEQRAARLSVRLLMPTGLCFLPAFICIGIIPSVVSFLG